MSPTPDHVALPLDRAVAARRLAAADASDLYALLGEDTNTTAGPGEAITEARRALVHGQGVLLRSVCLEVARGTPWSVIAARLSLPEDVARDRYEADVAAWLAGAPDAPEMPGAPGGHDPVAGREPFTLPGAQRKIAEWVRQRAARRRAHVRA